MDFKRPLAGVSTMSMVPVPAKKTKYDNPVMAIAPIHHSKQQIIPAGMPGSMGRTSNLLAPNMLLSGHESEVYCAKFYPIDGSLIATAGFDRQVMLWETYGECECIASMPGHGGAIMDLHFSTDGETIFTAGTDKTVCLWDTETCTRIKKIKGHTNFVNCCGVARRGPQLICSGSDDGTVRVWDRRQRQAVHSFENTYQVLSVAFSDTADCVYSGGIDNIVKAWDLRKPNEIRLQLAGHTDTVTGLSVSPDGSFLLSNAMDNTLRMWDIRPYAAAERCIRIFQGHHHTFEKNLLRCAWSPDSRRVTCGSGDRFVYVWDANSRHLVYKLPGHTASVNETAFHPTEPILISAGSDKHVFVGEIEQN